MFKLNWCDVILVAEELLFPAQTGRFWAGRKTVEFLQRAETKNSSPAAFAGSTQKKLKHNIPHMAPTSKTVDNTGKKQRRAWNATGHSNLEKKLVKSSSVSEDNILPEKETRRRNEVIYHNLQLVDGNVPPQNVVKGNLKRSRKSKNTLEKREKSKIAKPKKLKETKEAKKEAIAKKKAAKIAAKKAEEEETAEAEPEEKKEEEKKEEEPKADKMEVEQEEEKPKRKPRRSVGKKAEEEPKKPAESVVVTALKNLGCSLTKSVPRKFAKKALPPHIRKFLEYLPNKPLESKEHEVCDFFLFFFAFYVLNLHSFQTGNCQ